MRKDIPLLVKNISEGDHESFGIFYREYFRKCFSFALYFVRLREFAEDVVSEVFLMLWDRRKTLPGVKDLDSYIYISVRNSSLAYIKRNRNTSSFRGEAFPIDIKCTGLSPEDAILRNEFDSVLKEAIDGLPEKTKLVYHMVREEKLSHKEIGLALDISDRTVNSHMTTAKKRLADKLGNYFKNR